jgi:hypothetical protein
MPPHNVLDARQPRGRRLWRTFHAAPASRLQDRNSEAPIASAIPVHDMYRRSALCPCLDVVRCPGRRRLSQRADGAPERPMTVTDYRPTKPDPSDPAEFLDVQAFISGITQAGRSNPARADDHSRLLGTVPLLTNGRLTEGLP